MKIKKVVLHNYRGYRDEVFNFTSSLNTLIGTGDSGKSAVIKAIGFVTKNDQSGNIISNEIRDEKGKIIKGESCYVELHTSDGDIVRRERTRTDNLYQINDHPAIRNFNQSVPEDVEKILNLNEVNSQSQFETHFMLNDNAPTVAKTLNKMVNLEIIDESISNINKIVRKIKKEFDASNANLEKYENELKKFNFIEDMEKDVDALIELDKTYNANEDSLQKLTSCYGDIDQLKDELDEIKDITNNKDKTEELLALYVSMDKEIDTINDLDDLVKSISNTEKTIKNIKEITSNVDLVNELLPIFDTKSSKVKSYNGLLDCVESIEEYEKSLDSYTFIDKNKHLVDDLLEMYEELDIVKKQHTALEGIGVDIHDYNDDIEDYVKAIEKDFDTIKGMACPTCGADIKEIGGC